MFSRDYTVYGLDLLDDTNCDNYGDSRGKPIYIEHSPGQILGDQAEGFNILNPKTTYLTWGPIQAQKLTQLGYKAFPFGPPSLEFTPKTRQGTRLTYIPNHPDGQRKYYFPLLPQTKVLAISKTLGFTETPLISSVDIHRSDIQLAYHQCEVIHSERHNTTAHLAKHSRLLNETHTFLFDAPSTFHYFAYHFNIPHLTISICQPPQAEYTLTTMAHQDRLNLVKSLL